MPPLRFLEAAPAAAAARPSAISAAPIPGTSPRSGRWTRRWRGQAGLPWLLAGRILQRRDLSLATAPLLLPQVPDPAAFYQAVDCVLNPMVPGTGLKIKTVEALAHGRPVLGTRHAFSGLPAEHPGHCAADVPEMVALMRAWRDSEAFRPELAPGLPADGAALCGGAGDAAGRAGGAAARPGLRPTGPGRSLRRI